MVILINRHIGTLRLDAVISESHTSTLDIVENPVESGVEVADHAVLKPRSIQISGVLVDHEPEGYNAPQFEPDWLRGSPDFINQLLAIPVLKTQTQQTLTSAQRQLQSWLKPKEQKISRSLAPWQDDLQLAAGVDSSPSTARLKQAYQRLLLLQKAAEPVEIQTGFYLYKNMLITSIAGTQVEDGSVTVDISARELIIVESRMITGLKAINKVVPGKQVSGRSACQCAKKNNTGKIQPEPKNRKIAKPVQQCVQPGGEQ